MKKLVLMVNIKSMSDLPKMERWLARDHFPEVMSHFGPFLGRYISYRVVPPPPEINADAVSFGYYNWRITELWTHEGPPTPGAELSQIYFPGYDEIVGIPPNSPGHTATMWTGSTTTHPIALTQLPINISNDFKGSEISLNDPPCLRWVTFIKFPHGVPEKEAEDWYINIHAKEVAQKPGLKRYFSRRASIPPWYRVSEEWYESFEDWKKATIDSPPQFTKPTWAKYGKYPFIEPYVDFCSTFLLEQPTNDNLKNYHGYYTL